MQQPEKQHPDEVEDFYFDVPSLERRNSAPPGMGRTTNPMTSSDVLTQEDLDRIDRNVRRFSSFSGYGTRKPSGQLIVPPLIPRSLSHSSEELDSEARRRLELDRFLKKSEEDDHKEAFIRKRQESRKRSSVHQLSFSSAEDEECPVLSSASRLVRSPRTSRPLETDEETKKKLNDLFEQHQTSTSRRNSKKVDE